MPEIPQIEYYYPRDLKPARELLDQLKATRDCLNRQPPDITIAQAKLNLAAGIGLDNVERDAERWKDLLVFFDNSQTVESALGAVETQLNVLESRVQKEGFTSKKCKEVIRLIDICISKNPRITNRGFMSFIIKDQQRALELSYFVELIKQEKPHGSISSFRHYLESTVLEQTKVADVGGK